MTEVSTRPYQTASQRRQNIINARNDLKVPLEKAANNYHVGKFSKGIRYIQKTHTLYFYKTIYFFRSAAAFYNVNYATLYRGLTKNGAQFQVCYILNIPIFYTIII